MQRARIVTVLVLGVVVAACGTRLPDEAFDATSEVVAADASERGRSTTTAAAGAGAGDGGDPQAAGDGTGGGGGGGGPTGDDGGAGTGTGEAGPNQASDVGVTETTLRLGNITAENGVLGDTFAPAVRGLRAWVQHTNAGGGIHGRQVELFTCDDREDRSRSLECARRLVEQDQVFALVATNSRALGGAAQYLSDQGVPVLGFPITNSFYRYPELFSIYGSFYERDGEQVGVGGELKFLSGQFRWFREQLGLEDAAVFSYDIDESKQAADSFVQGLEEEGFSVTPYVVSFAAPSFDQAVADMERRGIQLVYDTMDDGANRRLCDAMARREFRPVAKVSTVVVMGDAVGERYNDTCRNAIHVLNESRPYTSDHDEVVEFREAYARYQPGLPLHQWALEAWAMGNIARDGIASMGPAPTREGLIEHWDTMEPDTAEGIMIGAEFAPSRWDYSRSTNPDCFAVARWQDSAGGWTPASSPFPFCYEDAVQYGSPALEQGN